MGGKTLVEVLPIRLSVLQQLLDFKGVGIKSRVSEAGARAALPPNKKDGKPWSPVLRFALCCPRRDHLFPRIPFTTFRRSAVWMGLGM
jgi:hypothetical protein